MGRKARLFSKTKVNKKIRKIRDEIWELFQDKVRHGPRSHVPYSTRMMHDAQKSFSKDAK